MPGTQSKRQRWIKLAACAAFVGLGVTAFFISRAQKDPAFVIDPLSPRPWADSARLIDLSTQPPWSVTAEQFFKGVRWHAPAVGGSEKSFKGVRWETSDPCFEIEITSQWPPYRLIAPDDANPTLKLRAFALGGWSDLPNGRGDANLPNHSLWPKTSSLRFYDPQTGESLAEPPIPNPGAMAQLFPGCPLKFQAWLKPEISHVQVQSSFAHDAFTRVSISGVKATKPWPEGGIVFSSDLRTLRPNTARLAMDLAVGEIPAGDFDIAHGKLTWGDGAELRMVELNTDPAEWVPVSHLEECGRFSNGSSPPGTILLRAIDPPGTDPLTNIYLGAYPYGDRSGFRFLALDPAGKELRSETYRLEGLGFLVRVRADSTQVRHLRVTRAERYLRQIVALPPIAELPASNAEVTDMWDLVIPCHRIAPWSAGYLINAYCHTQSTWLASGEPSAVFADPKRILEGRQVTVRELYQQMKAEYRPGISLRLNYDPALFEMKVVKDQPFEGLLRFFGLQ